MKPASIRINFSSSNNVNGLTFDGYSSTTGNVGGFSGATYSAATPLPFGVSTDLSIIILGSLYGASRLRKRLTASK